jgi:uncharacterized heparinase superfamily protein
MQVARLFQTLRHLRPRQIAYQLYYRFNGRMQQRGARPRVPGKVVESIFLPPLAKIPRLTANALPPRLSGPANFRFLNLPVSFPAPATIDWNYAANGKLWTYNLNYFEYLRQPGLDPEAGEDLIASWITNEATHADGWEPYPISLRLVNWLQFYRSIAQRPTAGVVASLRRQYLALHRKREFHLGGNHLLENAIALSMTARFFDDSPGRQSADALLIAELKEQYLPDGAHFELSVMYHLILLWRQLDLLSFLQPDDPLAANLTKTLTAQLGWAASLITPDGHYPHFNDSTDGIAPDWAAVRAYATALGLKWEAAPTAGMPSGYRYLSTGRLDLWVDVAAIGPDYIPGHAHADNLTFVLHVDGDPLIIDPATSTYEKNERRAWERSTRAHNTVTPTNGKNSSDVWGGFRVGTRARTTILRDQARQLTASHNGYAGTRHSRGFDLVDGPLRLVDTLEGTETRGIARLHFAPGVSPTLEDQEVLAGPLRIRLENAEDVQLRTYEAAAGFNALEEAWYLEVTFVKRLATVFVLRA